MTSLRTETGKHFVQVFKMWLKVGGKNRFFQSMIVLEESGIPKTSLLSPNPGCASCEGGDFHSENGKTIRMMRNFSK